MKRLHLLVLFFFLLLFTIAGATDIYVSPNGNDRYPGTKEQPLATLQAAIRKARDLRRLHDASIKEGIHIRLFGGTYPVYETIILRPEDSGTEQSPTLIEPADTNRPVLSGGVAINNWKKLSAPVAGLHKKAQQEVWVADAPVMQGQPFNFRQLWVNELKAVRAKSANGYLMHRILNWNKADGACLIPTLDFPGLAGTKGVELFIHQWWEIASLRIRKMQVMGDSTKLWFEEPESRIQNEHPWPAPWLSKETGNSAFYLVNALQFLDEPGEWYLDRHLQKIYYWPLEKENMRTAKVVAPFTETLVRFVGTIGRPVKYVQLNGLSFQHTGWLRPSLLGHVPHQIGLFMTEAYRLRPPGTTEKPGLDNQAWVGRQAAAVELNYTVRSGIENCTFLHTAATGLDLKAGVQELFTRGNLFKDIGGTAILAGNYGDEGREIHLPFNPAGEGEQCAHILIENNFITNAANEDWGTVGIGCGFVRNTMIRHNVIEEVSYTGISLGWGWTAEKNMMQQNTVEANWIHHYGMHNYDCSGIYTLSAQPGTVINTNRIEDIYKAPYVHLPAHWFYLYTDEGSSGISVINNWTPAAKYLQNSNGPGNIWVNNGSQVHDSIKNRAGLEKAYSRLYAAGTGDEHGHPFPINEEHPEVIELVVKEGKRIDLSKLKRLLATNNIDSSALYQWQNHYVIFARVQDLGVMQGRLQNHFPETEVKVYHDMFYEYSKRKHCTDQTVAKEWTPILLTANLVADKKAQQEYLDYHATQLEKWPDIARGFCNADFQQVLLFRNGRQLVLVISIPKGRTLDELNPKTVENNPKMNEWNRIMGKYQEGIEGTKKGETWVFLQKL